LNTIQLYTTLRTPHIFNPTVTGNTDPKTLIYASTSFPEGTTINTSTGVITSNSYGGKPFGTPSTVTLTDSANNNSVIVTINFIKPRV
jgi:hypothetical protein